MVALDEGEETTPEQVVRKLREADRLLAEGSDLQDVCRHLERAVESRASRRVSRGRLRGLALGLSGEFRALPGCGSVQSPYLISALPDGAHVS